MECENTTTYIINSKGYPGGISRKEYTWKEVLEFFNVEEPIDNEENSRATAKILKPLCSAKNLNP